MKEVIVSITFDHIGCHKLDGKRRVENFDIIPITLTNAKKLSITKNKHCLLNNTVYFSLVIQCKTKICVKSLIAHHWFRAVEN